MRSSASAVAAALLAATLPLAGCASSPGPRRPATPAPSRATLSLTSSQWLGTLAPPIACTDSSHLGHSPSLTWTGAPPGTVAFAVTVIDPDAGNFVHWAVVGLPASQTSLPEGASPDGTLPAGAHELTNGFGKAGYGGPCPPPGSTHHYVLTVWALHEPASSVAQLPGAALASGTLTATYRR
jgi:hypothetical protein